MPKGRRFHHQRVAVTARKPHTRMKFPFAMAVAVLVWSMCYSIFHSQRQLAVLIDVGYKTAVNFTDTMVTTAWTLTNTDDNNVALVDPQMDFFNAQVNQQIADPEWKQAWDHCLHLWEIHNNTYNTFNVPPELSIHGLKDPPSQEQLPMIPGLDASVIITSNLIPSHPSIYMINETIHSLHRHLIGLPKNTPIYISIDLPPPKIWAMGDNQGRLEAHVERLRAANFSHIFTNVQVVLMKRHRYIGGNVHHTLTHHVQTPFFYLVQHDMPFARDIDHLGLIQAMKDHPTILNNVRFRINNGGNTQKTCKTYAKTVTKQVPDSTTNTQVVNLTDDPTASFTSDNGLDFYISDYFSDNNHISTKWYYQEMMNAFPSHYFAMELYMMTAAREHCDKFGQQLYGRRDDHTPFLSHLDGRKGEARHGA